MADRFFQPADDLPITMKISDIARELQVSEGTLKKMIEKESNRPPEDGGFPRSFRVGASEPGQKRWLRSEVMDWIKAKQKREE